jgi:hypothetical protein
MTLDWTTEILEVSVTRTAGTGLADIDVCGDLGYPTLQFGSYSTITLAGQGVTNKGTDYIMVNQKFEGYFVTPLLMRGPQFLYGAFDQAAYFNEIKLCAPITGDFVRWEVGQRKDVTHLLTYPGKSATSKNCDFLSAPPPNTIWYDIAAPIVVKGMSAVMTGLVKSPGTNTKPSLRPLSLETDPLKFFVKVGSSRK